MLKIAFIFLLIPLQFLFSNDTSIEGSGGTLNCTNVHEEISILNELLEIDLYSGYYKVSVRYDFRNNGPEKALLTGFPEYYFGENNPTPLRNFKIWYGGGKEIKVKKESVNQRLGKYLNIISWYTKKITFRDHSNTTICLEYEADYGVSGFFHAVEYLIGTGSTWHGNIGKLRIRIKNNADYWIDNISIGDFSDFSYEYIADGVYDLELRNYEPVIDDCLIVTIISSPIYFSSVWDIESGNFIFKDKIIKPSFLRFYSLDQLRIFRNSIFAFRGYKFHLSSLKKYFSSFDWYKPDDDFSEELFSDIERANIKIIRDYEQQLLE